MRQIRSLVFALTPLLLLLVTAQTALAQETSPSPVVESTATEVAKGFCAPWHRCLAMGSLGLAVLIVLVFGLGFLIQRRGFDRIEHRQGNPEGIKLD